LNHLIVSYDSLLLLNSKYLSEWQGPKGNEHIIQSLIHDNQYLYFACTVQSEIYCYSLDHKLINTFKYYANSLEIINNQFYLIDDFKFFIIDMKTESMIQSWNLPKILDTRNKKTYKSVGSEWLKVDQEENIYFTPSSHDTNYIYFYHKNGKEIKKFGSESSSQKDGEFNGPAGITANRKYLYVCDCENNRVQVIDKFNGNFFCQWKDGSILLDGPQPILLYEKLLYVGDSNGIQVFSIEIPFMIQLIGSYGKGKQQFQCVLSLCIVENKLYISDNGNSRIQVWN